ncbi:FAD-dependent monooxygenase [Polynucleobacter rarus]|uniref:FAD-dependent monooxygenase n=1 Tax=Polynucleobacter rarus TaxID=556055 RepID=UPI000D3E18D3|nr:FAD-dependent monooxygenase [Polynucleobacter rarus]
MQKNHPAVLIVGAGPVGLASAIELGRRGIECLVIERNERVGYAPRAKTTNARTREHFRRWGIADQLRKASPLGLNYPSNVVFCTRLSGYELMRFENSFYCAPGRNPLYSEHSQWIPQYTVEEVMRAYALTLPSVKILFNTELLEVQNTPQHVLASYKNRQSGDITQIQCAYLIGADGSRSKVREVIDAKMEGQQGLSKNYNIVFSAPGLDKAHELGPAIMYWQVNPEAPGLIGPMDRDRWFFMPTGVDKDAKFDLNGATELIKKSTGIDLPYEVLSSDEWIASRLIATHYSKGRIFLAGDACHLHPPFGGYGMNMGIADGVDLGWKIAANLQGWGGTELLNSYELERRPVHDLVMNEAVVNHAVLGNQLWREGLEDNDANGETLRQQIGQQIERSKMREFTTLGVILGYRYEHSPVMLYDGQPYPENDFINYVPSSRAGCLAPHAWLHDGSSLYDHFGMGFTLLFSDQNSHPAAESLIIAAQELRIPLKVIHPTESAIGQLYPKRFTLIRPDQHVAWTGDEIANDAKVFLYKISGQH